MNFGEHIIPESCVVYKTEHTFVFVNIRPFLPYHLLISPIVKYTRLVDVPLDVYQDMMQTIQKIMKAFTSLGDAYSLILQDGEAAGQTVKHLHFHLIPRKHGDLKNNNEIYEKVSGIDSVKPNRSIAFMEKETEFLKQLLNNS